MLNPPYRYQMYGLCLFLFIGFDSAVWASKIGSTQNCAYLGENFLEYGTPYATSMTIEPSQNPLLAFEQVVDEFKKWISSRHDGARQAFAQDTEQSFLGGGLWSGQNSNKVDVFIETISTEKPLKSWGLKFKHNCENELCPRLAWETNVALTLLASGRMSLSVTLFKGALKDNIRPFDKENFNFQTPNVVKTILRESKRWQTYSYETPLKIDPIVLRPGQANILLDLLSRKQQVPIILVMQSANGRYPIDERQFANNLGGTAILIYAPNSTREELLALAGTQIQLEDKMRIYFGTHSQGFSAQDSYRVDEFSARIRHVIVALKKPVEDGAESFEQILQTKRSTELAERAIAPFNNASEVANAELMQQITGLLEEIKKNEIEKRELIELLKTGDSEYQWLKEKNEEDLAIKEKIIAQLREKKTEMAQLTEFNAQLKREISDLNKALLSKSKPGIDKSMAKYLLNPIRTPVQLVNFFEDNFGDKIAFTDRAKKNARDMENDSADFTQLWDSFIILSTIYYDFKTGELMKNGGVPDKKVQEAIGAAGFSLKYAADESEQTKNNAKFKNDRRDEVNGETIFPWEHLKGRQVKFSRFSIYFIWNERLKKVVISSFPEHLSNFSSSGS